MANAVLERVGEDMSEREKEIMEKLGKALPSMSDFDKGYILCMVEKSEEKEQIVQQ